MFITNNNIYSDISTNHNGYMKLTYMYLYYVTIFTNFIFA